MHYIYLLQMKNDRIYVGYTTDLDRRFNEHATGKGAKTTRAFGASKILYTEQYRSKSIALRREYELKRWSREEKLLLVKTAKR